MDVNEIVFTSTWLTIVVLCIAVLSWFFVLRTVVGQIQLTLALRKMPRASLPAMFLPPALPRRWIFDAFVFAAGGLTALYVTYSNCTKISIMDSTLTFHYCWPRSNVTIHTSKIRSLRLLSEGRGYRSIIVVEADQMKIRCPALPNADAKEAADRLRMAINSKE